MPTMLWFPEVLEPAENWERWFNKPENMILDYRNVWILNGRNFGDSDHHDSFDLEDISHDINRFIDEKQLTFVTVGGHGYGAKIASAFGSYFMERTSGVICMEGGPIDVSYHESWEEIKNAIIKMSQIKPDASQTEVYKIIDAATANPKWRSILKQNLIDGKGTNLSWKCNMQNLAYNVSGANSDISSWSTRHGLYTGNALAIWAGLSNWIYLATNTIPFYIFFPKLEGKFPSNDFNFVQEDEAHPLSKH